MRIVLKKWPDSPHYEWEVETLGKDERALWYGCLGGTPWTRGPDTGTFHTDSLFIVPKDSSAWWLAELTAEPNGIAFYAHVCTPPSVGVDSVTAIDLDLDVQREPGGEPTLLDEDEFATNSLNLGYPKEVIETAVTTGKQLMLLAADWDALLASAAESWFPALKLTLSEPAAHGEPLTRKAVVRPHRSAGNDP